MGLKGADEGWSCVDGQDVPGEAQSVHQRGYHLCGPVTPGEGHTSPGLVMLLLRLNAGWTPRCREEPS